MGDGRKIKLADIADIRQGYQVRKEAEGNKGHTVNIIKMADITTDYTIEWDRLSVVRLENIKSSHYLENEDIIFCARGADNYSIMIDEPKTDSIAAYHFLVISPDPQQVVPAYLAWFLQLPVSRAYFTGNALRGTVPLVKKETLAKYEIPLIDLEKQERVAELYKLKNKEKTLVYQLADKREKLINAILYNALSIQER